MNFSDFQDICKQEVLKYAQERVDVTDNVSISIDDVYVVWYAKTLQNAKALLSTTLPDGMYYELTYNGEEKALYLDAYKKFENKTIDLSKVGEL